MDVQNLRDTYPQLIAYLEDHDYSTTYASRFTREIKRILARGDFPEWTLIVTRPLVEHPQYGRSCRDYRMFGEYGAVVIPKVRSRNAAHAG